MPQTIAAVNSPSTVQQHPPEAVDNHLSSGAQSASSSSSVSKSDELPAVIDSNDFLNSVKQGEAVGGASSNFNYTAAKPYLAKEQDKLQLADKLDSEGYHDSANALRVDASVDILNNMQSDGIDISGLKASNGSELLDKLSSALGHVEPDDGGHEIYKKGPVVQLANSEMLAAGKSIMDSMPKDQFDVTEADKKAKTDWLSAAANLYANLDCLGSTNDDLVSSLNNYNAAVATNNSAEQNKNLMKCGFFLNNMFLNDMDSTLTAEVSNDLLMGAASDDPLNATQAMNEVKQDVVSKQLDGSSDNFSLQSISKVTALSDSSKIAVDQMFSCFRSTI